MAEGKTDEVESLFEKAQRLVIARKGWVTREIRSARTLLGSPVARKIELKIVLEDLEKRVLLLHDAQSDLESYIKNEDELAEMIDEAGDLEEAIRKVRGDLKERIKGFNRSVSEHSSDSDSDSIVSKRSLRSVRSSASSINNHGVKLPKLELKKFNGEIIEWPSFWDKFQATVGKSDIPNVSKFSYLESLLEGNAKRAIQGLTITDEHYKIACDILVDRFGRKDLIVFHHIQSLISLATNPDNKGNVLEKLRGIQDKVWTHTRCLETLGTTKEESGKFLTPLILSALPSEARLEWAREGEGKENDLNFLLDFIEKEIKRRERSDTFKNAFSQSKPNFVSASSNTEIKSKCTASALTSSKFTCIFCGKNHSIFICSAFKDLSVDDRYKALAGRPICFKCLRFGHTISTCTSTYTCPKCGEGHSSFLHRPSFLDDNKSSSKDFMNLPSTESKSTQPEMTTKKKTKPKPKTSHVTTALQSNTCSVFQMVQVFVYNKNKCVKANVLFDTGSDQSYVSSSLVKKLRLSPVSSVKHMYNVFGGGRSHESKRNVYHLNLKTQKGDLYNMSGVEVPVICSPVYLPPIPDHVVNKLSKYNIPLLNFSGSVKVDILIGLDSYWNLIEGNIIRIPGENLVVQNTLFGFMFSGQVKVTSSQPQLSAHQLVCLNDFSDSEFRQFWDLETIGIRPSEANMVEEDQVLKNFNENIAISNDRYEVSLPWKEGRKQWLQSNRQQALGRLRSLGRRLQQDEWLQVEYNKVFEDMLMLGYIEPVDETAECFNPVFYLPHHPVVKKDRVTSKVRPVFDASAKGPNDISLNDCLESGPCLLPDLTQVLIRFRRFKFALVADITKAFLQVSLSEKDRDTHRILLYQNQNLKVFRFTRVTFGINSSPFLLNATIKFHLSKLNQNSRVVEELSTNLYVDDWLTGADTLAEASEMYQSANQIMSQAGMSLAKWNSNDLTMAEKFTSDSKGNPTESTSVKVLGLSWDTKTDTFFFKLQDIPKNVKYTKRLVLSLIARVYDPLGFISPYIMSAKCLFQSLWQQGLEWDDELQTEDAERFHQWMSQLELIAEWSLPRRFFIPSRWSDIKNLELHAFGDASQSAYGAVVYIRAQVNPSEYKSMLVMSKGRVAPLKKVTLPRLELLAALLAARLLIYVKSSLYLENVTTFFWTDSMATLGWIKGDPNRWKPFVANRVREIQNLTIPGSWLYCPGTDNPADMISRGVSAKVLVTSKLWINGPNWLSDEKIPVFNVTDANTLLTDSVSQESYSIPKPTIPVFDIERWSSFSKSCKIVGWVIRFVNNLKCKVGKSEGVYTPTLRMEEFSYASSILIRQHQSVHFHKEISLLKTNKSIDKSSKLYSLSPFLDSVGVLRVKGRLGCSNLSYTAKHPIILTRDHLSLLLARHYHINLKHAGVDTVLSQIRESYWVIGLRKLIKFVINVCVPCQRVQKRSCNQGPGDLPHDRVNKSSPFSVVGIDHAGPLYVKDYPKDKFYICLFTCATTRAIHLELVDSLSVADLLIAFRKFISRRGTPSVIYSDNAKNFQAVQSKLFTLFNPPVPRWKFIAPRAPWWGGWWERMVRSVKLSLKKTLTNKKVTKKELITSLCEVEFCVNSRPLTYLSDDIESFTALTPNHFLLYPKYNLFSFLGSDTDDSFPEPEPHQDLQEHLRHVLRDSLKNRHSVLSDFWKIWSKLYISGLPKVISKFKEFGKINIDDLVLIQEDVTPRLHWVMGRVVDTLPSADGTVRCFKVKTPKGVVVRPIQRLHLLELFERDKFNFKSISAIETKDKLATAPLDLQSSSTQDCANEAPEDSPPSVKESCAEEPVTTRSGRVVRIPHKLNL